MALENNLTKEICTVQKKSKMEILHKSEKRYCGSERFCPEEAYKWKIGVDQGWSHEGLHMSVRKGQLTGN